MSSFKCTRCGQEAEDLEDASTERRHAGGGGSEFLCPHCATTAIDLSYLAAVKDVELGLLADAVRARLPHELPYIQLLDAIKNLVRAEHVSERDRLDAVDWAITMALTGDLDAAEEWAYGVGLGLLPPWDRER